jgi:predicted GNAT family acetyltransferase
MQIKHHNSEGDGIFYIDENGKRMGDMRYMVTGNQMDIFHTEVDKEIEGQSWGKHLIEAGVNYARENHLKIIPSCTFARTVFASNKSYQDVLA